MLQSHSQLLAAVSPEFIKTHIMSSRNSRQSGGRCLDGFDRPLVSISICVYASKLLIRLCLIEHFDHLARYHSLSPLGALCEVASCHLLTVELRVLESTLFPMIFDVADD